MFRVCVCVCLPLLALCSLLPLAHSSASHTLAPPQTNSFVFDKVYGSGATQTELYDEVGRPICAEVVKGYHCAILAYGQTGTGKTYTM